MDTSADQVSDRGEQYHRFKDIIKRQTLIVDGVAWNYLTAGSVESPTLLILPGGERFNELGFCFVNSLQSQYHIIYPSYPSVPSMSALVKGVLAILDAEHVSRASVFGASFGGNLAQCLMRQAPDRFGRVILANTGAPERNLVAATRWTLALVRPLPDSWIKKLLALVYTRAFASEGEETQFWSSFFREQVYSRPAKRDVISLLEETIDYRLNYKFGPNDLVEWPGRVLLILGERDVVVNQTRQVSLTSVYPRAQVKVFTNAGHIPWLRHWDEFIQTMVSFLA